MALRRVFRIAQRHALPVLVHLRSFEEFGAIDAEYFVREILSSAPAVSVKVAHLGGWAGYDAATDEALEAGRVVFGSDWPFYASGAYLDAVAQELREHGEMLALLLAGRPAGADANGGR